MRILFIANHLNVGGITSYLLTLTAGLVGKGHQVYLASAGGQLEQKFRQAGVTIILAPLETKSQLSPKILFSFWKLKKIARAARIQIIHSQSRTTQVLGERLSQALGCAHIFTCHGFFKPKLVRRLFGCWGDKVIAISQEVSEHLILDFKLDAAKIVVINNGIAVKNFGNFSARERMRKDLGINENFLIGIIARLSDVKGHLYLMRAMKNVREVFPAVKLLIIGEGKMKEILVKEAEVLGIKGQVLFIPEASNTQEMLAAMDIFVLPSLQEGLGLALMEAMAQGLAVVGSSVGGIKTLVQNRQNGLLVAPADVSGLAQAMITLLGDAQLRQHLGAQARAFIAANFSQEEMVDKSELVYRQFIKEQA